MRRFCSRHVALSVAIALPFLALSGCGSGDVAVKANGESSGGGGAAGHDRGAANAVTRGAPVFFSVLGAQSDESDSSASSASSAPSAPSAKIGYLPSDSRVTTPFMVSVALGQSGVISSSLAPWKAGAIFIRNLDETRDAISAVNFQDLSSRDLVTSSVQIKAIASIESASGGVLVWLDSNHQLFTKAEGGEATLVKVPGLSPTGIKVARDHSLLVTASGSRNGPTQLIYGLEPKPHLISQAAVSDLDIRSAATPSEPTTALVERARNGKDQLVIFSSAKPPGSRGVVSETITTAAPGSLHEPRWSASGYLAYWHVTGGESAEIQVVDPKGGNTWQVMVVSPISELSKAICLTWVGDDLFFSGLRHDRAHVIMRTHKSGTEWHTSIFTEPTGNEALVCPHGPN